MPSIADGRPVFIFLILAVVAGCGSSPPTPSFAPTMAAPPSASASPSVEITPTSAPAIEGLSPQVLDEALSAGSLELALDERVVRLTRDDFLSGLRRADGREIVGAGPSSDLQFWFVLGARPALADAAWVEIDRSRAATQYAYPTEPMADFIQIIDPDLPQGDLSELHEQLRIGTDRILHPPQSDITADSRGVRYHLIGDVDKVYLLATSE